MGSIIDFPQPSKMRTSPTFFFFLTFFLSWLIWIPLVLLNFFSKSSNLPESTIVLISFLGVLMPSISAIILTKVTQGSSGLHSLFNRFRIWRVGWQWWSVAALGQPSLLVLSALIYQASGSGPSIWAPVGSASALLVNLVFLLLATTGEEIGWRGLALPALQQRMSALNASIVLGLLWGLWHVPYWLLQSSFAEFGISYLFLTMAFGFPLTFYITWFFNHTGGSLLLPIAFHFTFNVVNVALLPVTLNVTAFIILGVLEWSVAFVLIKRLDPARMINKNLSQSPHNIP